jgi:RIO kinase 1
MGIIDEVVRPLMSGKEAQVYLVLAGGEERVAKVYKEADQRSFRQRTDYTDGRNVRSSRDRRAMSKGSRYGRAQDEAAWRSAEVDVIYKLHAAGVRVPTPHNFVDGVLVMQMVTDADGRPAPRLGDLSLSAQDAKDVYDHLVREVVRMLCAGVVHGDLSDFNVLMGADGPVVIDFPQAVDPASNSSARRLLMRDVDNLHRFLARVVRHPSLPYAQEMWELYERGELTPETRLGGRFRDRRGPADTRQVLELIGAAERDARHRGAARPAAPAQSRGNAPAPSRGGAPAQSRGGAPAPSRGGPQAPSRGGPQVEVLVRSGDGRTRTVSPATTPAEPAPAKKRRRRRRRSSSSPSDPPPDRR